MMTLIVLAILLNSYGCGGSQGASAPEHAAQDAAAVQNTVMGDAEVMPASMFSLLHEYTYIEPPFSDNLDQGVSSKCLVLSTKESYEKQLALYSDDVPETVDFSVSRVLLLDNGVRPSSGYRMEVTDVAENENCITVTVVRTVPNPEMAYASVITHPVKFYRIYGTKEIVIQEEIKIDEISQ